MRCSTVSVPSTKPRCWTTTRKRRWRRLRRGSPRCPGRTDVVDLLVLGGTRFVGRAVVQDALARGWTVTALHRGVTPGLPDAVRALHADRTDADALARALGSASWDAVVDTWSGGPSAATAAARLLAGRVGH